MMAAREPEPPSIEHIPVLYQPILEWLRPGEGKFILDGTVGGGGHAEGILEHGAEVLGLDRDPEAIQLARRRLAAFGERVILRQASYRQARAILMEIGRLPVDGILLDLGLSSLQLADPERGFAFRQDGPLDMRFDRSQGETAADLVNTLPAEELERILSLYGEERDARRISRAIVSNRPLTTTRELAEAVTATAARRGRARGNLHPATRTFQALRIAVNHELDELREALPDLMGCLAPGGRMAVISFHSLEDRIVKQTFRKASGKPGWESSATRSFTDPPVSFRDLTVKPIRPETEEIAQNPRARSAKLRVIEKPNGPSADGVVGKGRRPERPGNERN
jgi:16S rRNA (cytosine1402-N4)-methyltransferase